MGSGEVWCRIAEVQSTAPGPPPNPVLPQAPGSCPGQYLPSPVSQLMVSRSFPLSLPSATHSALSYLWALLARPYPSLTTLPNSYTPLKALSDPTSSWKSSLITCHSRARFLGAPAGSLYAPHPHSRMKWNFFHFWGEVTCLLLSYRLER